MNATKNPAYRSLYQTILSAELRLTETTSTTEARALRGRINVLARELATLASDIPECLNMLETLAMARLAAQFEAEQARGEPASL